MGFDALIDTFCCTYFVLFGLWIIADVVQAVELLIAIRAYERNEKNVFALPFVPLLTRLFHEMAVPKFLASEAIQRGELPPAVTAHGHQKPAAVPVEYVGPGTNPSFFTLPRVTGAPLSPSVSSTTGEVPSELSDSVLTGSLRGKSGRANKEGKRKRTCSGVDQEDVHRQQGQQRHDTAAVVTVDPTHVPADGSALTASPDPTWWTPKLEGRSLVLGLQLPLELLPVSLWASQASASEKVEANGVGGMNGTGATTRQPTVNLQLKQYQVVPASPAAPAITPSLSLRHHNRPSSNAGRQVRLAVAQQLSVAPLHVYTRASATRTHRNMFFVPSPLTRTPSRHFDFDAVKYSYTQYCQRLLEVAVAEQTAILQRVQHDRKSTKRAQRIAAMLMRYLEYTQVDNDVEDNANDGDAQDGAGATRRAEAGRGNITSGFPSQNKRRGGAPKRKGRGGAGAGRTDLHQLGRMPWIPVLMSSACNHNDEYDAVGRDVDSSSSAPLGHSLHHTAVPLPSAQSTLPQQSFLQRPSSSSPTHSSQIVVVPSQLPHAHELRRGSGKRRRRAEEMPSAADSAVETLERLVERVRLAQTLRPRYQSLICNARFAAERFVVRRGASEPPTWTSLHTDAASRADNEGMARGVKSSSVRDDRGTATQVLCQSSSSSSLSPHGLRLHRRHRSPSRGNTSPALLQVAAREASASAFGAQGSWSVFNHPGASANYHGSSGNTGACASATVSSQISSRFTDGQLPADARFLSREWQPLSAATALEGSLPHHRSSSSILNGDRSDPLTQVLFSRSLGAHPSGFASAQALHPNAISTAPAHASAEIVVPLELPSESSRSTSAANAAIEFLRGSHFRENNKRADIAAGVGSSFHSTTVALAETQAPPEGGSSHQSVIKDEFSMSAEKALQLSRSASAEETQRLATVAAAESTASGRLEEELQSVASSSEKVLQSTATAAAPPPPRISASASPVSLPPRSTDLRVVYVIGADRATLLRCLTLDATRSFAAGTQNFLCFFTPRDERRAQRRYMEQLDRQNRAELQRLAPLDALAGSSQPREQRGSNSEVIDCVCASNAVPLQNRAEERLLSASVAAACRDASPSNGDLRMSKPVSGDGALESMHGETFGNAAAVNQQPRAMRSSNATNIISVAGANLSTPAATSANSTSATGKMSAHQRDDSSFSTLQSLESSVCLIREPRPAVHSGISEVSTTRAVSHSGGGSAPFFATIPALSMVRPSPSTSAPPTPIAARGNEKDARGATATSRSPAKAPTEVASNSKAADEGIPHCSAAAALATGVHKHVDVAAAAAGPVVDVTPPTVAATALPIPEAAASKKGILKERKGATTSAITIAAVSGRVPPLSVPASPIVTDSVSVHDVRQYVSVVGVTLPEQVYLLRDACAPALQHQLQRSLAATSHNSLMLHSRRESYVRNTGSDTPSAAVSPTVGVAAVHGHTLSSACAAAVLHCGATRVLEGQVEVAELSCDVLSRQILPFVPMRPTPLSDSDDDGDSAESSVSGGSSHGVGYGDTSESHSCSSVASDDGDDNIVVREDAADVRRGLPSRRRGKQPQMSKTAAASNHQLRRSPRGDAVEKRSRKASLPPRSCSRRRHQKDSWSRDPGQSGARSSQEQRQRQHARRLKRHLARWNRQIQRRRAAAIKARYIPVAVGALFFTAPPTLPSALVQQQRQRFLAQLERGERARLLVPEWALNGSEVAARAPDASEDIRQERPLVSPSSLHEKQSPPPSICVTLIYTATAEQVAQALLRAEVAAAAAAADRSAAYDAVRRRLHQNSAVAYDRGKCCPAAAAVAGRQMHSSCDSYELVSSNAGSELYPPTPLRQRTATVATEESRRGRREPSSVSTAPPSKENSLYYSCLSESFTPQQSRGDLSTIVPDFFLNGEELFSFGPLGMPATHHHRTMSPPNSCSETAVFSDKDRMENTSCCEVGSSGDDGTTASDAAAAAEAALVRVHDRLPSLLLLTESSDSVYDGRKSRSGVGGSAAAAVDRWAVFGSGAAGADPGDTVAWAESVPASAGDAHANEASSRNVRFKAAEVGRSEEDKFGVAEELMNVLRDSACFPDGVPVGVSLAYVRIGNDLYAITEVVDRSFLQYREERVMQAHTSRQEGGGRRASDGEEDSFTPLSDSGEDAQENGAYSSSSVTNSSFALGTSFNTLDSALEAIRSQHKAAARQQRRRLYHRCRAISTSDFGGLSYSLAGSAPLRSGMRRQEVHMCWRCLSAEAVVIFVPCGHYAVCEACAEVLADCCVCRTPILSSVVLLERSKSQEE